MAVELWRCVLGAFAALAAAWSLAGCGPPRLAGMNDAVLEYALDPSSAGGASPSGELAVNVKARLALAQVMADVDAPDSGRVRVIVDADAAGAVDELLRWRGGLEAYETDDDAELTPADASGLQRMTATRLRSDGASGADQWWQGSAEAVARAVREGGLPPGALAFAERLPNGQWRTRVVKTPAVTTLGAADSPIESIALADHGRALALTVPSTARTPLDALRDRAPRANVAIARASSLLATIPATSAAASPLVLPFGGDLPAYARAHRAKLLLSSPNLPALQRTSVLRLPPRPGLAAACALLPCVLSLAWLSFVRRFDRARPEPVWLVGATFVLGGLSVLPAAIVEMALAAATPWLDPSMVTLGGQLWAFPLTCAVFTLVPGAVEEGAKWLAVWSLAAQRREFDEPVDGIVYACAAALGFAAVENVKYFALGRMSGVVIAVRAFMTVPAHMFFAAIWGSGMGRRLVSRRTNTVGLFALAALAHGAFDATLSIDGLQQIATLIVLVLGCVFVLLLQRALRYGAVFGLGRPWFGGEAPPATEPVPASALARGYFRVGSPGVFYACAATMITSAFLVTVLGTAFELLHHRVGVVFVAIATAALALFGVAAYGASAAIPLDVVIDAQGLTFSGARMPWRTILGVEVQRTRRSRAFVCVTRNDGVVLLGPAHPDRARDIALAIAAGAGLREG